MNILEIARLEIELKYKEKQIKLYTKYIKKCDKLLNDFKNK